MFIRYPGSKAKLWAQIRDCLPFDPDSRLFIRPFECYCEPFFGAGAIAWKLLPSLTALVNRIVVNEIDPGMRALWLTVRDDPLTLVALVRNFRPSPDRFYQYKELDGAPDTDPALLGFRKLALHQMSFSGLGYMSGGPLGGREQRSEYNTACRWSPARIADRILKCHKLMKRFRCFDVNCGDFGDTLRMLPTDSLAYLDPPYYVQGEALYRHSMTDADHVRLAEHLKSSSFRWVLSYDDHPRIRQLYEWATIHDFEMTPTMRRANGKRRKNREIVICSQEW